MNISYKKLGRFFTSFMLIALGAISWSKNIWAEPSHFIQTGRYLTVDTRTPAGQSDLLSPLIQIHFLSHIKTIGEAIQEVLRYSGYDLIETQQQSQDLQKTLQKPLPLVQRDLGPMSLRQSLKILIGPAFHLIVDPLNRTVNFQLNADFQTITD